MVHLAAESKTANHVAWTRVARLRSQMEMHGIEAAVCTKPEMFVIRGEHAQASAWTSSIRLFGSWSNIKTTAATWQEALGIILNELGVTRKRIGVEHGSISVTQYREIAETAPEADLVNISPCIDLCRQIKDVDEVDNARVAARIADVGMEAAVAALRQKGATERDVAIASMQAMNEYWATNYPEVEIADFGSPEGGNHNGLTTWVLSGPRKSYACDNPTPRAPKPGETVSVFIWTVSNGIHAELERTVCIGPASLTEKAAIKSVLEIREEIEAHLRPGIPVKALYETARNGYISRGYSQCLPGRIGHSIGLGSHESVSINGSSDLILTAGMVLTLEPHIHIFGVCGTQFSDTLLITEAGFEYLTHFPRQYLEVQ
ncbi:hypothetical protein EYZ11_007749 [Aspergillus tanneri]|uniref:Probable Xaa-Pro aminopeptidase P n=1 Tax=Aspergillus tanneri TaxID=1220188 RepID=A0A4S3JEH8_9EURO|nr:hypothetical protein EYZ11_007749 [Aspergillus tanneri]